jgi:hypothetical protein
VLLEQKIRSRQWPAKPQSAGGDSKRVSDALRVFQVMQVDR